MSRFTAALFVASFAFAAPVPKAVKKVITHPTAVGTRWEYTHHGKADVVSVVEVTHSEAGDDGVHFRTSRVFQGGDTLVSRYTLADGHLRLTAHDDREYTPPILEWKHGATDGEAWPVRYTVDTTRFEATHTVGREEELTTPAGKFTAVPVTSHYTLPKGTADTVWWYAVGVGLVRMESVDQKVPVWELKAFTPAP